MDHATGTVSIRKMDTKSIAECYGVAKGSVGRWASEDKWMKYGTNRRQLWDFNEAAQSYKRRHPREYVEPEDTITARVVQLEAVVNRLGDNGILRCTAQFKSGKFCDRGSVRDAPFPICVKHAAEIYGFIRDQTQAEDSVMDAMANVLQHRDCLSPASREPSGREVVYYLQVGEMIKIGTTKNLGHRLQSYPPNRRLLATEPGSYELEQRRIKEFSMYSISGEWFHLNDAMIRHAAKLRRQAASARRRST